MILAASTPTSNIPSPPATPKTPQADPKAPDSFEKAPAKSGALKFIGRAVFYGTAACIPGVGAVSNFLGGTIGTDNVLKQRSQNPNLALTFGLGALAAAPNVLDLVTHNHAFRLASMFVGGAVGIATAYQSSHSN